MICITARAAPAIPARLVPDSQREATVWNTLAKVAVVRGFCVYQPCFLVHNANRPAAETVATDRLLPVCELVRGTSFVLQPGLCSLFLDGLVDLAVQ